MSPETIRRCFRKAGILDDSFSVVTRPYEHDPFLDIDSSTSQIPILKVTWNRSNLREERAEFINVDDDLVTCSETDDDSWDQQFLASLDSQSASTGASSDPEEEEEEEEEELGPP